MTQVSENIIKQALCTYIAKGTRYITRAEIIKSGENSVSLKADFEIYESCYLYPGSGHFNAVEALICFNQMLYVALLGGIEQKYYDFYQNITAEDFNKYRRQGYILEFEKMKFKKQIDNHHFHGTFEIEKKHSVADKIYASCKVGFGNDELCNNFFGSVKVFIPVIDKAS